jgi:3',5'-cyclic AMP phosphodiesterase CpdA
LNIREESMPKRPVSITGITIIIFSALLILGCVACAQPPSFKATTDPALQSILEKAADFPETSFTVFSDPHIYDPGLGTTGAAFESYIANDRKLLRESPEILDATINAISGLNSQFVLVCGDLTKDGELASHLLAVQYLAKLESQGKKIYVVPGNHDIRNGHSFRYTGDTRERVPNITAEQFAEIYAEYGFKEAIQKDSDSLSYVAEPEDGLWLLALDSCNYKENIEGEEPITDGKFS